MYRLCLYLGIFVLGLPLSSLAQNAKNRRYVIEPSQSLCATPGGKRRGEVFINTPVEMKEVKGAWVKVSLEGWVRSSSLGKSRGKRDGYKSTIKEGILDVTNYKLTEKKDGLSEPRIYITLSLKNNTSGPITSWSGLLVAQDQSAKVLFREPVSDGNASIPAQGSGEVKFYWTAREVPFGILKSYGEGSLRFTLFKVQLKR